jgi:hypothetical protein
LVCVPAAGQPACTLAIKTHHFPFIAQNRSIQVQGFSVVVRVVSSITSVAGQIDPGTGGSNVYPLTFPAPDKDGFSTARQNGGLGLTFDPTQP